MINIMENTNKLPVVMIRIVKEVSCLTLNFLKVLGNGSYECVSIVPKIDAAPSLDNPIPLESAPYDVIGFDVSTPVTVDKKYVKLKTLSIWDYEVDMSVVRKCRAKYTELHGKHEVTQPELR